MLLTLQDWRILEPFLKYFERFLDRILGISSIAAENGKMSENVYLSTALRREANSRGCRGTKMVLLERILDTFRQFQPKMEK